MTLASETDSEHIRGIAEEVVDALALYIKNSGGVPVYSLIQGVLIAGIAKALARQLIQREAALSEQPAIIQGVAQETAAYFLALFELSVQGELAMIAIEQKQPKPNKETPKFQVILGGKS